MLSENLKLYRQKKGHTQESLAIQLHVVRQTVSKWEKGLSVPDAETLQRIAEVLEISVNDLLNTPAEETLPPQNDVALQLARLNEQLAIRNRRSRLAWKVVGITFAVLILIGVVLLVSSVVGQNTMPTKTDRASVKVIAFLEDGRTNTHLIHYNDSYDVTGMSDSLEMQEPPEKVNNRNVVKLVENLKEYYEQQGCRVIVGQVQGDIPLPVATPLPILPVSATLDPRAFRTLEPVDFTGEGSVRAPVVGYEQMEEEDLSPLHYGDVSARVADMQRILQEKGYYEGSVNGIYDTVTQQAVTRFQQANQLLADGTAGNETLRLIFAEPTPMLTVTPMTEETAVPEENGDAR